jgi:hypothetical protein
LERAIAICKAWSMKRNFGFGKQQNSKKQKGLQAVGGLFVLLWSDTGAM